MKRWIAIGIDLILLILTMMLAFVPAYMGGGGRKVIDSFFIILTINFMAFWFYNFLADLFFESVTIGKKIMGVRIIRKKNQKVLYFALSHSLLKQIFMHLGWISIIIICIMKGAFIYDKWLGIEIKEKQ